MTAATVLAHLLCTLTIGIGPAHAQENGAGAHQQEYAGKHCRLGYRKHNYVNRDGYVSDNTHGVENPAYYGRQPVECGSIPLRVDIAEKSLGDGRHGSIHAAH